MEKTVIDHSKFDSLEMMLLSTLNEETFFTSLASRLQDVLPCKRVFILKNVGNGELDFMVSTDSLPICDHNLKGYQSIAGHVIRNASPYYSNDTRRDPLFAIVRGLIDKNIYSDSELCLPLVAAGQIIGTIHFQSKTCGEKFGQEDIKKVRECLALLVRPLNNMGMYLSAKNLSELLRTEIEEKDKKLRERNLVDDLGSVHHVKDFELIGKNPIMLRIRNVIDKVAQTDLSVLIVGGVGSGKESIARKIHIKSFGINRPFVVVDSFMLTEENFEEQMFGHSSEAFLGSGEARKGLCELAEGGTLFFSNIGLLSSSVQAKIFYFIIKKKEYKISLGIEKRINVRIMASCIEGLEKEVEIGRFNKDLYYALRGFMVQSPSLMERTDDIESLALHFLNEGRLPLDHKSLSPEIIRVLKEYGWPDNVKELKNVMHRAYVLSDNSKEIKLVHLPEAITAQYNKIVEKEEYIEESLHDLEQKHIIRTLDHVGGNKTRAAKILGITVKTLYNRLHSYGMIIPRSDAAKVR